jgi:hypothetical protein
MDMLTLSNETCCHSDANAILNNSVTDGYGMQTYFVTKWDVSLNEHSVIKALYFRFFV